MRRRYVISLAIVLAIIFVFLVPLPIAALQPPQPLEPVAIYGSFASKFFGVGPVFQQPYGAWGSHWSGIGSFCIQQYLGNGAYSFSCILWIFWLPAVVVLVVLTTGLLKRRNRSPNSAGENGAYCSFGTQPRHTASPNTRASLQLIRSSQNRFAARLGWIKRAGME